MKTYVRYLVMLCALSALVAIALLLAAPSAMGGSTTAILPPEHESQPANTLPPNKPEAQLPVIFPPDPGWPEYAQREITVHPEPPIPGQPTEVCAWVVNTTGTTQTVTLDFGVANFGIGLLFDPIGTRTIQVPPFAKVKACVVWVPREAGHWCIQVLLKQGDQYPVLKSQRNIDIWEVLTPGQPAHTVFPVRNSTGAITTIELSPTRILSGWAAYLTPPVLADMGVGESRPVTLTVVPPPGKLLGSREPIVDVEARSEGGQGPLIGGFRKLDMPPVPLHRLKDPPYAESEISIDPYPSLPGEPVKICAELRNLSDAAQTVKVSFQAFNPPKLGIGLPWGPPFGEQTVEIPPRGLIKVCATWIPAEPGQFCIRVNVQDPQRRYVDQWSQLNLDVNEVLRPGEQNQRAFPVGNPLTVPTDIVNLSAIAGLDNPSAISRNTSNSRGVKSLELSCRIILASRELFLTPWACSFFLKSFKARRRRCACVLRSGCGYSRPSGRGWWDGMGRRRMRAMVMRWRGEPGPNLR